MADYKRNGDVRILKHLGEGGYGSVDLIEHPKFGIVAYKQLRTSNNDEKSILISKKEADIQTKLRHPNITVLYEAHFDFPNVGFYLEFMKYGSVDRFIDDFEVSWHWKTQIIHDVALGMSYLHKQAPVIVHGDLKCGNILIGEGYRAKISDFGLARMQQSQTLSKDCAVKGTLAFIPPEYLQDPYKKKTEEFDVYGFAISAWEIFKGKRAYHDFCDPGVIAVSVQRGDRPKFEGTDFINNHIRDLIVECWHQQPDQRPTFEHVCDAVKNELSLIQFELQQSFSSLKEQDAKERASREPATGITRIDDSAYGTGNLPENIEMNQPVSLQNKISISAGDSERGEWMDRPLASGDSGLLIPLDSSEPSGNKRPISSCFAVVVVSLVGAVLAAVALGIALGVLMGVRNCTTGNPCRNGGTCFDSVNGFKCLCDSGYIGTNCETDINECASNPCLNSGICTDLINMFTCNCVSGYTGTTCETNIDECGSNPCSVGGTCHDGINSYACICQPGCSGPICDEQANLALGQPAHQSSTYGEFAASRVVDGNYTTDVYAGSCSNTNDGEGYPNWLMVDLGSVYIIGHVVATNIDSIYPINIHRMSRFFVGVTNTSWTIQSPTRNASSMNYPLCGQYPYEATGGANMTVYCTIITPPARYVIIQQPIDGPGYLNFCELQVYSICK